MTKDLTVPVSEGFTPHEEDKWYEGVLKDIEPEPDGKFGPQFKWVAVLDEDKGQGEDGADRETFFWTSQKVSTHEKNKAGKYYTAITGRTIEGAESINVGECIGERVKIMFEHGKKEDGSLKETVFRIKAAA